MEEDYTREAPPPDEEAARVERFVEDATQATDLVYQLLLGSMKKTQPLARDLVDSAGDLYRVGHGSQAVGLVENLADVLRPVDCADPDCFNQGVHLAFAAGCLAQWRALSYLVGQELPLWPVQRYATDHQID